MLCLKIYFDLIFGVFGKKDLKLHFKSGVQQGSKSLYKYDYVKI